MRRANYGYRTVVSNRRKRLVHERRKKIVERRGVFFQLTVEDSSSLAFK